MKMNVFLHGKVNGPVMIKGLKNKVKENYRAGQWYKVAIESSRKNFMEPSTGLVYIDVPASVADKYVTVLKVKLDKPLGLYKGSGGLN